MFRSALSTRSPLTAAVADVGRQLDDGQPWDALVAFVTTAHDADWGDLASRLIETVGASDLIGCSAEGVVGSRREIEEGVGLSVLAIRRPGTQLSPIRLEFTHTAEGAAIVGWPDAIVETWPQNATLLLLADPFSFPADHLLEALDEEHPGTPVLGGMASGASAPGDNRLFLGDRSYEDGAVGWMITGGTSIECLVSQGCRPIGETFVVTAAEQNLIKQLGGKPALEQLQRIFAELPTHEQQLVQRGLHLGRVVSEYQDQFEMGDFLIRNVLGVDRETHQIAIGDYIRPGQTVQFHLRDEHTASAELKQLLASRTMDEPPGAALLFTCNGRGTRLFSDPHHDATCVAERFGDLPLAGFFAQGEIGPIGGRNFLHGYTASVMLWP